jgi:hypothetical protein
MKKLLLLLVVATTLATAIPSGAMAAGDADLVYGPNAHPHGASYPAWTRRFARFLFEPPVAESPLANPNCDLARERGGVLLLPVAVDVGLRTHCRVEEGTDLLISPGGSFYIIDNGATRQEAVQFVNDEIARFHGVKAVIDGERIPHINRFLTSSWINLHLGDDNLFGDPAGTYPMFLKGWILIVKGLDAGRHKITIADVFPTGPNSEQASDITFIINVVEDND